MKYYEFLCIRFGLCNVMYNINSSLCIKSFNFYILYFIFYDYEVLGILGIYHYPITLITAFNALKES